MSSILVIPDTQCKPGDDLMHIEALNRYILDKRPDNIVQLGDWFDFPSLSLYDKGKKAAEGRRLTDDWEIGCLALAVLMDGWEENDYNPERLIFTAGNHEYRVDRHGEEYPALSGSLPDYLGFFEDMGWEAYPFLEPVELEGIMFSHFFPKNSKGGVSAGSARNGASSAMAQLRNNMTSCIAGHKQGMDSATYPTAKGRLRSEIVGSFYQHDEDYMGPQGNSYWRGVLMLHEVDGLGDYLRGEVSLDYLMRRYL